MPIGGAKVIRRCAGVGIAAVAAATGRACLAVASWAARRARPAEAARRAVTTGRTIATRWTVAATITVVAPPIAARARRRIATAPRRTGPATRATRTVAATGRPAGVPGATRAFAICAFIGAAPSGDRSRLPVSTAAVSPGRAGPVAARATLTGVGPLLAFAPLAPFAPLAERIVSAGHSAGSLSQKKVLLLPPANRLNYRGVK